MLIWLAPAYLIDLCQPVSGAERSCGGPVWPQALTAAMQNLVFFVVVPRLGMVFFRSYANPIENGLIRCMVI